MGKGKLIDLYFDEAVKIARRSINIFHPRLYDFLAELDPNFEDEPDIKERKEMNQKEIMELGKEMFWENQIELWNKKKEVEKRRWI